MRKSRRSTQPLRIFELVVHFGGCLVNCDDAVTDVCADTSPSCRRADGTESLQSETFLKEMMRSSEAYTRRPLCCEFRSAKYFDVKFIVTFSPSLGYSCFLVGPRLTSILQGASGHYKYLISLGVLRTCVLGPAFVPAVVRLLRIGALSLCFQRGAALAALS